MTPVTITTDMPREPSAPLAARRIVAGALAESHPGTIPAAALAVSEVVSNAVIHGSGSLRLEVDVGEVGVTLTVTDCGTGFSLPVEEPDGPGGYGLLVVDCLAEDWGVEEGPPTVVWCRIPHG